MLRIVFTPIISIVLYKDHLAIAYGHLEFDQGKVWLGASVVTGFEKQGYGSRIVEELCDYADRGGIELWLTCHKSWLVRFYSKYDFQAVEVKETISGHCFYMRRVSVKTA